MYKILIGCPVHNRGWILPYYLEHIRQIDYPEKNITLCFILNDCRDESLKIILDFRNKYLVEYADIIIREMNFNMADDTRQNRIDKKIYKRLAAVRNAFMECLSKEDYVFSVDSDILIPVDCLKRLLSHKKDIISALVYNDPAMRYPNILNIRDGKIEHYFDFPKDSLFEVDITGAVYLLKSEVCRKVRYEYHIYGEDVPFCISAKKMGYSIWCDSSIQCRHIMHPYMLK